MSPWQLRSSLGSTEVSFCNPIYETRVVNVSVFSDLYGFVGTPSRITRTIVIGLRPSLVRRILYILSYFIRCNEVYENIESRTKSMLTTSASSESIFSNEVDDTQNNEHKFEDKIVRHLTGDVESIAIPKNSHHHVSYASSSIESSNSVKSVSHKWFHDTTTPDERPWSPDPFALVSSPSSSSLELATLSPSGSFHVAMPKYM